MATPQGDIELDSLFGTDIFELLGIQAASSERKQSILETMMDTVQNRVLARILDSLTDVQIEAFQAATAKGDDEARQFLADQSIDLIQLTAEEAIVYKGQILSMATGRNLAPA